MTKNYYITTTLPYVNSDPHIGFALEIVQADVLARYQRLLGKTVVFNTGTDEHGKKIADAAAAVGLEPKAYCDGFAAKFDGLKAALNLTYTNFVRTTDEHHVKVAQAFWMKCKEAGDIYKKSYEVKYCVGCELEKTDSDLVDGKCPLHPKLELEMIDEENYFFKWSKYQDALLKHYAAHPDFVVPHERYNEIKSFVEGGLHDFSVSRLKSKMPWGIAVPDDADHVMYVWFDALVNYISTIGWPEDMKTFEMNWPGVQVAGKDNLRQQSAMWQGMLASAGLPFSEQVFIHGFITNEGHKMSKSTGNTVNPYDLVEKYGTDAVRHYLLGGLPSHSDGDYSTKLFEEHFGSKLANGIGNLAARVTTMIGKYCGGKIPKAQDDRFNTEMAWRKYDEALTEYRFDEAVKAIEELVSHMNKSIDDEAPFKKAKEGIDVSPFMYQLAEGLRHAAVMLLPIIPNAAEKILGNLSIDRSIVHLPEDAAWGRLPEGNAVTKEILFPRLNQDQK